MCDMCPMSKKQVYEMYQRELRLVPELQKDLDRRKNTAQRIVDAYEKDHS